MKTNYNILFLPLLVCIILNACTANPSLTAKSQDAIVAKQARLDKLNAAWPKLRKGMDVNEAKVLIGIDPAAFDFVSQGRDFATGMRNKNTEFDVQAPVHCEDPCFSLVFTNGKLTEWRRP